MSDTAAFFATKKKKGKKKAFKSFNANKIDASTITSTVHVDAPAVTGGADNNDSSTTQIDSNAVPYLTNEKTNKDDDGWEDPIVTVAPTSNGKKNAVAELLDMNALRNERMDQDNIAERMRVEETKAALAAARTGMKNEAKRLKEIEENKRIAEEERKAAIERKRQEKEQEALSSGGGGNRFGVAAANVGGGKWVPPHMRGAKTRVTGSVISSGSSKLVDTKDAMDFPDLASANAAVEAEKKQEKERLERQRQKAKKPSIKPGWGAPSTKINKEQEKETKKDPEPAVTESTSAAAPAPAPTENKPLPSDIGSSSAANTPSAVTPKKAPLKKKKKKKDLSTFKPC
eukprot:CAMPEP_0178944970 /NCGR_PEP_ID=MMETSP0789-20121207/3466_1 /TAXON_ID=3005 /ORGANISM="Rhizosolenia setigera, Strain CCMP 1694" /LENGTH=343 /DNA_ID=CAMNT_0020624791 /DNA_START=46 /DNA_END=1077 /DNA_ORIENTATION=-